MGGSSLCFFFLQLDARWVEESCDCLVLFASGILSLDVDLEFSQLPSPLLFAGFMFWLRPRLPALLCCCPPPCRGAISSSPVRGAV